MQRSTGLALLVLLLFACAGSNPREDQATKGLTKLSPAQSLLAAAARHWNSLPGSRQYLLEYTWKPMTDDEDTARWTTRVILLPDPAALFGRRVVLRREGGYETRFDGTRILNGRDSAWESLSDTARIRDRLEGILEPEGVFPEMRVDRHTIDSILAGKWSEGTVEETELLGVPVWRLRYGYPDDEETRNIVRTYDIRRSDTLFLRVALDLDVPDIEGLLHQHTASRIDSLETGFVVDTTIFSAASLPAYAVVTEDTGSARHEPPPLIPTGELAPDFALATAAGDTVRLSALKGKVVLLDFWYKGCGPCREAIPAIQHLHDSCGTADVAILGLNIADTPSEKSLQKFLRARKVTYPILYDAEPVAEIYHVRAYPTMYIIGRDGRVAWTQIGYGEGMESVVADQLVKAAQAR